MRSIGCPSDKCIAQNKCPPGTLTRAAGSTSAEPNCEPSVCESWCASHVQEWEMKCTWSTCAGCSACPGACVRACGPLFCGMVVTAGTIMVGKSRWFTLLLPVRGHVQIRQQARLPQRQIQVIKRRLCRDKSRWFPLSPVRGHVQIRQQAALPYQQMQVIDRHLYSFIFFAT